MENAIQVVSEKHKQSLLHCQSKELFWKLVKLRVKPDNERITVLIHGAANLDNIMFSYDEMSGRPNQVKFNKIQFRIYRDFV